jgi:hypothetical protein
MIGPGKFGKNWVPVHLLCTNLVKLGTGTLRRYFSYDISPRPDFPGGREQDFW